MAVKKAAPKKRRPGDKAPDWIEPKGHVELVRGLSASASQGTLPHALLFEGTEGIGKFRAAMWLAATLLCDSGPNGNPGPDGNSGANGEAVAGSAIGHRGAPCGECGPCKRVRNGSHADVLTIEHRKHEQNAITLHFIATREPRPKDAYQGASVEDFLALRAAEGRGKFVVVREAEKMVEEAQNAFLKTLEEPRPGVHLILECSSRSSLLATVRSRVVPVHFDELGAETCEAILWDRGPFERDQDEAQVAQLVRMSGGSPGIALRLLRRSVPAMAELLALGLSGKRSPMEVAAELFDLDGDFPGKTASAQRRTQARTVLDLGLEILVDTERLVSGADPLGLSHGDAAVEVASGALLGGDSVGATAARRAVGEAWISAREDLNLNLSPEALVERALSSVLAATPSGPRN